MREMKEAEFWLESAKDLLIKEASSGEKYTVIVAQAIHSIIRANDALTLKFLGKTGVRHDDAPELFLELVRTNKIPAKYADLRKKILIPAVKTKSIADYRGLKVSKADAENWVRLAEKFLDMARDSLLS
ncbi:MAG: hypothetical protein AB1779_06345 [Candidatus Thermoplasmatota archaeon]